MVQKAAIILFPVSLVVLCFFLVPSVKKNKKQVHKNQPQNVPDFYTEDGAEGTGVKIMIQPLGKISAEQLEFITQEITSFYKNSVVTVNATLPLPLSAWYEPRQRYVADSLLGFLLAIKADDYDFILGITDKDIATRKGKSPNYGIMGYGFCPGQACVVSTFRLHKKIKSSIGKKAAEELFKERFSKVCLHELGHNFGLPHCPDTDSCLMHDANGTMAQVDMERKFICKYCRNRIKAAL